MNSSTPYLTASEAAGRLGVSAKALRLYEQRGLVVPLRTAAGWRSYGPAEMAVAAEIVALRALGLSLAQVARVLTGEPAELEPALAAHQAMLEGRGRQLAATIERIRRIRADLVDGRAPAAGELPHLMQANIEAPIAFDLPWPWGGERFELGPVRPITYIIGPLGSGKTRLAQKIADTIPGGVFLGLERSLAKDGTLDADPTLMTRVERTLGWLAGEGASSSEALTQLVIALEATGPAALVVDMVEQNLDQVTQEALAAWLRHRAIEALPLFLMTRSSAILDLSAVGGNQAIILCPANHAPPSYVEPWPGAAGYEAVATCLATPEVRARTAGVIAWRPQLA